jgi:ABC-type transport system involved in cytochrome bd biosynthesis fused ATPase/permease subunit
MSLEIMQNIRDYLPDSLIIYATHSAEEAQWAHRIVKIQEN